MLLNSMYEKRIEQRQYQTVFKIYPVWQCFSFVTLIWLLKYKVSISITWHKLVNIKRHQLQIMVLWHTLWQVHFNCLSWFPRHTIHYQYAGNAVKFYSTNQLTMITKYDQFHWPDWRSWYYVTKRESCLSSYFN